MKDLNSIKELPSNLLDDDFLFLLSKSSWGNSILIMEKNGHAFARLSWYNNDSNMTYLDSLTVDEEYRKKGLGTKLQQIRERISIYLGASSCCLFVKEYSWMKYWNERRGYVEGNQVDLENNVEMIKNLENGR